MIYAALAFLISAGFFLLFLKNMEYLASPSLSSSIFIPHLPIILFGEALLFIAVGGI